jgi:hypothetical protein
MKQSAVVFEALPDFTTATELADRVFSQVEWLDGQLEHFRQWVSEVGGRRLTWTGVRRLAAEIGIEVSGFFEGKPGLPDAQMARRALLYLRSVLPDLAGILLIRDQDDQPQRRAGLKQACDDAPNAPPIVIGLAIPEREAWVLAGFVPLTEHERERLATERQTLGFDPCAQSHRLTDGKNDQGSRSPKRVLHALTAGDLERQRACWLAPRLEELCQRGQQNGLAAFVDEVRERFIGVVSAPA